MFKIFLLTIFALLFFITSPEVFAQSSNCSSGSTLNIVAHQDDDLLFLSTDLLLDIKARHCVTTIYVTAGDANLGSSYWRSREDGVKAAYASMANASNSWRQSDININSKRIPTFTLRSNSSIALIFLRLPDGNWDGSGFSNNSNTSIKKLWQGNIQNIKSVDGASTYTKQELITTLSALMVNYRPDKIRTQNYIDGYSGADHSDHFTTAYAALEAHKQYTRSHTFVGYLGYSTSLRPVNLSGADLTSKKNAFYTYGRFDSNVCSSTASCQNSVYGAWLERQYVVSTINGGSSNSPTPAPSPSSSIRPTSTPRPTPTPRNSPTPRPTVMPSPTSTPISNPTPPSQIMSWTGDVTPLYSERYEFCLEGNGGFKLWVDSNNLIDEWDDDTTEECDPIRLSVGKKYSVRVESKSATIKLYWESSSQQKQIIPISP